MLVDSTLFYVWEVQTSDLTGQEQSKTLIQAEQKVHWAAEEQKINSRRKRTFHRLHGSMQNQAGPTNMCENTRETCTGQKFSGGLFRANFLALHSLVGIIIAMVA
jgi:hypothetical protein